MSQKNVIIIARAENIFPIWIYVQYTVESKIFGHIRHEILNVQQKTSLFLKSFLPCRNWTRNIYVFRKSFFMFLKLSEIKVSLSYFTFVFVVVSSVELRFLRFNVKWLSVNRFISRFLFTYLQVSEVFVLLLIFAATDFDQTVYTRIRKT